MTFSITQAFTYTPGEALWELKERLVAGGGTVTRSSDATTFGAGDNLAPGGPYAGEWDNINAWCVIQMPADSDGVVRETMLQLTSLIGGYVNLYVSSDGIGFSGGGATTRPTASDEQFLLRGTSSDDLIPVIQLLPLELTFWIGDASEEYSWLFEVRFMGGDGKPNSGILVDVLRSPYSAVQDPDKAIYFASAVGSSDMYNLNSNLSTEQDPLTSTGGTIGGWFKKGTVDAWVSWTMTEFATVTNTSSTEYVRYGNTSAWPLMPDGTLWTGEVFYARGARDNLTPDNYFGIKGKSRFFRSTTDGLTSETMLVLGGGTLRLFRGLLVPWDPSLPKGWA